MFQKMDEDSVLLRRGKTAMKEDLLQKSAHGDTEPHKRLCLFARQEAPIDSPPSECATKGQVWLWALCVEDMPPVVLSIAEGVSKEAALGMLKILMAHLAEVVPDGDGALVEPDGNPSLDDNGIPF